MSASSAALSAQSSGQSSISTFNGYASYLARFEGSSIFNGNPDTIRSFAAFVIQNPRAVDSFKRRMKRQIILELSSAILGVRESSDAERKSEKKSNDSNCSNPQCSTTKKKISLSAHAHPISCKCKRVFYCCFECRDAHWEKHRKKCKEILIA